MSRFIINQTDRKEIDKFRDIILNLWKKNLSNSSIERFDWLYKNNPYGSAITWLAKVNATGEFVGCNSLYPQEAMIQGVKKRFGIAIDFAVNKENRVFGPALQIEREIAESYKKLGFDCIFAWPSPASTGVFIRAGYKILGEVGIWMKPLNVEPKITKFFRSPFLGRAISSTVNIILALLDKRFLIKNNIDLATKTVEQCDCKFDLFLRELKQNNSIVFIKTREFLNWRYAQCPYERYSFFCLTDKRDTMIKGYIVYSVKDNSSVIWDIEILGGYDIRTLLIEFSFKMRQRNISTLLLTFLGDEEFEKKLKETNFIQKKINRPVVVCSSDEVFLKKNNWFLTDGPMDL